VEEGQVDDATGPALQPLLPHVAHHAHDGAPRLAAVRGEAPADGIALAPVLARQPLVDDDDTLPVALVALFESAAAQEGDAQRVEVRPAGPDEGRLGRGARGRGALCG